MSRNMDIKFYMKFSAKPIWNIVSDIRRQIKSLVEKKDFNQDITDAMETTAMELFENAIKYGISTEDAIDVLLEISFDDEDKELKIAVCNGIESQEKIQDFLDLLNKIKNSNDLEGLYMERLHEIAQNPKSGKSQLGLYRIAYETEYLLNYEISGKKLIITATKKIEDLK
ncbi:MAG: hypothetical protein KBA66_22515 [Leptospiraceae bacterium]|nr:hypothetical protein [Leptospiraceae bacterium]